MNVKHISGLFTGIIVLISSCSPVSAYIDPGTGSAIIGGSIWPAITGFFIIIAAFFKKKIISLYSRFRDNFERKKQP